MNQELHIDALLPVEMAQRAEQIGMKKAGMATTNLFALALLAGAFVALGAIFSTTVAAGANGVLPYGITRLLIGLSFCLGLILIIVGGAELFTGNTLIVMAWASGKVTTGALLRNWVIVYGGNFVGAIGTALLLFLSKQYTFGGGSVGMTALSIANSKVHFDFLQAIALGALCNALVCLAVWLTFSARSTTDKILAILFPITAFITAGFEHSIANMYFIPLGLLIKAFDPTFVQASGLDLADLTWRAFFIDNLLPVTIGNIGGGVVLVAAVYWLVFLQGRPD